jgi:hypothetical protein
MDHSNMETILNMPPEHPLDRRPAQRRQFSPLSSQERATFKKAEAQIERFLNSFVELGRALRTIRNQRLYRESHPTFRAYMVSRWSFQASRARQIIDSVDVYDDIHSTTIVAPGTNLRLPANEAQCRELVPVKDAAKRREIWQVVITRYPYPTAERIKEVVREMDGGKPNTPQRQKDFQQLYRHAIDLMQRTQHWADRHPNLTEMDEEGRGLLKRLIGACRDLQRF